MFRGEEAGESVLEEKEGGREEGARARASAQMWSWLSCEREGGREEGRNRGRRTKKKNQQLHYGNKR